jgi:exonuclease SbcC
MPSKRRTIADGLRAKAATTRARLAELDAEIAATPEPDLSVVSTPAPDVVALREEVEATERASKRAAGDVVRAEQRLGDARESAGRLAELDADKTAHAVDLADWTKLGADLGRDGLQAILVDSAGPELATLANDLLLAAFGPRWSVNVITAKPDSTGKKTIECCDVSVLDTVSGEEKEIRKFSGGEGVILGESIALALSMMACRRAGTNDTTIVRDESGAALDVENGPAWVAMLRRAAEIVGCRQLLFVTHSPALVELADAVIEIPAPRGAETRLEAETEAA